MNKTYYCTPFLKGLAKQRKELGLLALRVNELREDDPENQFPEVVEQYLTAVVGCFENTNQLLKYLDHMADQDEATIIYLEYDLGLSLEESAEKMGKKPSWIRDHKRFAMNELSDIMRKWDAMPKEWQDADYYSSGDWLRDD